MDLFKLVGKISVDADEAKQEIKDTTDEAEEGSDKITEAFKKVGGAVAAFFAVDAIKDFGAKCVSIADSSSSAINGFAASTGTATEELQGYEDVMHRIYKNNFGESFEDVAGAMATIKQQAEDIGADELEKMTTNALTLRDTFDFEVNESFRAAKMLTDQFGISGEEAYNLIAQGAQNGLDKNGDLLDSINEYAVHYEQLGFTAEDFFNSLANGTEAGTFSVDKLGDAMKEFGIRAKDGSDGSKEAFKTLGLDADDMFKKFNKGGEDAKSATQQVIEKLMEMEPGVEQTTAGVALFGTMWEDLGADGIAALGSLNGEISTSKNSLEEINAVKYDNIGSALSGLGRAFEVNLLMPIGEKLIPVIESAVEKLNAFGTWCSENETTLTIIGIAVATLAAAIGAYNIVLNLATITQTIATAATTAFGAAVAFATAPITLIIVAIGALIAIGVLLYKNWDEIKAKCIELGKNLKEKFTQIKDNVVNKVTELKDKAVQKFNDVKTKIVDICSSVVNWVKSNWQSILTFFINPFAGLFTYFYQNSSKFREFVDNAINAIKQLPSKAWTWLQNTISKVTTFASNLANKGKQAGKNLLTNVVNGVKSLPSKMLSVGKDVVKGIWEGITNAKDWLLNKIKGFTKTITKGIKDFFGIKSPSRVMRDEVGKMLAEGVAEGIDENSSKAENSAEEMGKKIVDAAQKRLDDYKVYNELTLADEVAYWDKVRQLCAEGTDARINADKNYLTAKKSLDNELLAAEEELQNSLNAIYEKVSARKKEILNSLKLFEDDDENMFDVSMGWYSDIKNLENYLSNIEALEQRIGGTELFDAVREKGLDASGMVTALLGMTESQLQGYINMYDKRSELAGKLAEDDLKDETLKGVAEAYETFYNKCSGLGVDLVEDTAAMETSMSTSFTSISEMAVTKSTEIVGTVRTFLADLTTAFESFSPKLKMPHFTISGSLDIENGTVPTVAVEWYKKAMNSPMLLDNATIFGYNRATGNFMGGGEAGSEVVAGANTLMGMIKKAVAEENSGLVDILAKILRAIVTMDGNMGIHLREALEDLGLEINNREFARLVKAVN